MLRSAAALLVVASAYAVAVTPVQSSSGGAPTGFAGDFQNDGVPQTCNTTGCHASFDLNSGSGSVTVDAPTSVAPGETVRITVTVDNQTDTDGTRRQGFQAIVKDPDTGEAVGRTFLTDAVNTRFAGFRAADTVYVTHTASGTAQTSWSFDWTAPTTDVPAGYRVYVAGNAANGNNASSGDRIYTATADVAAGSVADEATPEAVRFRVSAPAPNPVAGRRARLGVEMEAPGDLTVSVVDGLGRHLRTAASGPRGTGRHEVEVDVEGLAPGLYFVVADGPGGRRTQPISVAQ